ncbi:MAG TPA: glucose-6-phosphate isomerase, partial [Rhodospirillaceae bacterium]|nr:glucose-6-phosphate isomerase [Rhodospirillaceae bacterium]
MLERLDPDELARCITVITEPGDNPLRKLAARYNLPVLDHDPRVGGRYSVLSVVGMLPTLISGLDAVEIRQGAQAV